MVSFLSEAWVRALDEAGRDTRVRKASVLQTAADPAPVLVIEYRVGDGRTEFVYHVALESAPRFTVGSAAVPTVTMRTDRRTAWGALRRAVRRRR